MIGTIISHYRVTAKLGEGGMGEVYRAEDARLGRQVALKLMSTPAAPAAETWERLVREAAEQRAPESDSGARHRTADPRLRFLREARTVSALNHPGIVTIYDVGEWEGRLFIAMELVEGETLRRKLEQGAMTTKSTVKMAITLAEALQRAHSAGVVHRDIKPENIIITTDGQTKLLDFGIAKLRRPDQPLGIDEHAPTANESLTMPGFALGTIHYMSPEQARMEEIDHRSDLFSLGSVLYECLAGRKAFAGNNVDSLFAITHHPTAPIRQYDLTIPSDIEGIVEKLMEKDRDERYQSAADLLVDLRRAERRLSGLSTGAFRVPPGISGVTEQQSVATSAATPLAVVPSTQPVAAPTVHLADPRLRLWVRIAIPLAAAAIGALAMFLAMRRPTATAQAQTYPVTHFHRSISQPSFSPDGKLITFISDDYQVFVALTSSGDATQLTKSGEIKAYPRFSSDGSRILFHQMTTDDLWEVPALGGEPHRVLAQARYGVWSPDGARLAFSRIEPGRTERTQGGLYVGDARGANPRQLASIEGFPNVFPAWTPDGRTIVYMEAYQQRREPRLQAADAGGASPPRTLASEGLVSQPPAVSPDGRWVYYSALKDGIVNLWRVALSGGRPEQVTYSIGEDQSPALDSAGWLYYVSARHRARLHLVDETGTKLLGDDTLVVDAQMAPDGHVAFLRPQWSGTQLGELMLLDHDGHVQHVDTPGLVTGLNWSPDGKHIGYSSRATGVLQAYVTDLGTGRTTPMPSSPGRQTTFRAFSTAGQCLLERADTSGTTGDVVVFDPATGKERVVAQGVNSFGFSSDAKWVGLVSVDPTDAQTMSLSLAPVDGGEAHTIFRGVGRSPWFAPDSARVLFVSRIAPFEFSSIPLNDGAGGPPEVYPERVLLQAISQFGLQSVMDFDPAHHRVLMRVNESDMDIVRRKANP
jgi:serine/threonine protein kinase/Tol biopolymer transport system component